MQYSYSGDGVVLTEKNLAYGQRSYSEQEGSQSQAVHTYILGEE